MLMVMTPEYRKHKYLNSSMYTGGKLRHDLPELVQQSTSIESLKRNYNMYKLIISSWLFAFLAIALFMYHIFIILSPS